MSDMPELRSGRPWAMEEMIDAEPGLVEPVLAAGPTSALAAQVRAAVEAGAPVVLAGCGTSEHAAMAGAAMLDEALGGTGAVRARDAFEASLEPQDGGLLIGVSHEAGTPATLAAIAAAAGRGAATALVTARPAEASLPDGTLVVGTPLVDTSWCHTVGYLSPLLAFSAVASHLAGETPDIAATRAAIDAVRAQRAALADAAAQVAGCPRLLAVASGVDEITARELALKIEEGTHVPVTPLGLEKVLHGHLPAADADTGLVLLRFDAHESAARDARAAQALAAVAELSMRSALVTFPAPADLPRAAGALLTGALAAQLLTLELVHARGTNPDLIRREQEPYRRAADVAEAS